MTKENMRSEILDAMLRSSLPEPIAIVGLAGYFPQSKNIQEFWKALDEDRPLIEEIPNRRIDWAKLYDASGMDLTKSRTKWGGIIPEAGYFDPAFFGILPAEASAMDPRTRLLLMATYNAIEDAGYAPASFEKGKTGVFIAIEEDEYRQYIQHSIPGGKIDRAYSSSLIANHLSYFFNFRGPSEIINTMCSGAAVAIHRAVRAIRDGEISAAVVGAANIMLSPDPFIYLSATGQMSPTNTVRSFGKDANGFLRADGVGAVILKPLSRAIEDKDAIYATIKNTAVNYNGRGSTSIAAPDVVSHTELIRACYEEVHVDPRHIGYIEAQGMGNPVADIVEWEAFNRSLKAIAKNRKIKLEDRSCRISTLKPMTGHMNAASALGALFKIIRSFKTDRIHKIIGLEEINPDLDLGDQPCRLAGETENWPQELYPRLAGLHSYGAGGNNAHILVEEYKDGQKAKEPAYFPEKVILPFSAVTEKECKRTVQNLMEAVAGSPEHLLPSIAYTLQVGRDRMKHQVAFAAETIRDFVDQARRYLEGNVPPDPGDMGPRARGDVHRLHLPVYGFDRKEYWIDREDPTESAGIENEMDLPTTAWAEDVVRNTLSYFLKKPAPAIELNEQFSSIGFDSLLVIRLIGRFDQEYGIKLKPAHLFEHTTPAQLAAFIREQFHEMPKKPVRNRPSSKEAVKEDQAIAVIGLAGSFPKSPDIGGLWKNIVAGNSCIEEVPEGRWPAGKSDGKWGGFIEDLYFFDPLFFKISPREAAAMNPKERLFLQTAWHVMEDAGYTPRSLADEHVGVFAGVTRVGLDPYKNSMFAIPNRVSYAFNFRGPSIPVDTACSSSLVAIHEACQHIRSGECTVAIAGGVHAFLHASHFGVLADMRMLSPDGVSRSFGDQANGMVPGEGVGAVLLKPLSKAIADRDHIYGIIRGSSTNHGGKSNGFTVPNPRSHRELIENSLKRAGVHAREISYVEAHGTGTPLGDPIEIQGLTAAFGKDTADRQYCALGSIKSNIGHLEAAAGISGLSKILLQMKYGRLVPSLHSQRLNPEIDFSETPFYVQQRVQDWAPVDKAGNAIPKIACVSSFGAGGSNAHVIVEDWPPKVPEGSGSGLPGLPVMFRLSAGSREQLRTMSQRLLTFLEEVEYYDGLLQDLVYTLQVGREVMEERLVIETGSLDDLKDKLGLFIKGDASIGKIHTGNAGQMPDADRDETAFLNGGRLPRRISLPGYPFLKEYYGPMQETSAVRSFDPNASTRLHPLVHVNISTFNRQAFRSLFTGGEFFLADHRIDGQRILPGVAYLEMVHAALRLATGTGGDRGKGVRLQHVAWIQPMTVADRPVTMEIDLTPAEGEKVTFEIRSEKMYSQGSAHFFEKKEAPFLDLGAISGRMGVKKYPAERCYKSFDELGIGYGPAFRTIDYLQSDGEEALAGVSIRPVAGEDLAGFYLPPGLMDAAFQTVMGMEVLGSDDNQAPLAVPFALREMNVYDKCTEQMWVHVRRDRGNRCSFDMDLCDASGRVCVELRGYVYKQLPKATDRNGILYLKPSWQMEEIPMQHARTGIATHIVLCPEELMPAGVEATEIRWLALLPERSGLTDHVVHVFRIVRELLAGIGNRKILLQVLLSVDHAHFLSETLGGILKTAHLENPAFCGQVIVMKEKQAGAEIMQRVRENGGVPGDTEIRYGQGHREVRRLRECKLPENAAHPWKEGAVYVITGGGGGLGIILAKDIVSRTKKATLILVGRSVPDGQKAALPDDLRREGIIVEYRQADITDADATLKVVNTVVQDYGTLDYVIHCAGILRDNFILRKTEDEVREVIAPKIAGLVNLDTATKEVNLERFIVFSSVSGVTGNIGQADYAMGNAFMDGYAKYRNSLVSTGERRGQTVCIDWPLWKEGGMQVDLHIQKVMEDNLGMQALTTAEGIGALYSVMASGYDQVAPVKGDLRLLRKTFLTSPVNRETSAAPTVVEKRLETEQAAAPELSGELRERAVHYFKKILAGTIQLSFSRIEAEASFERYGIDSVMMIQMTNELEKSFGTLPKTLFFEYNNIDELTRYFQESHAEKLKTILGEPLIAAEQKKPEVSGDREKAAMARPEENTALPMATEMDIAVVGLSGRYPQATNLQEFWSNLCAGRNCITEIPGDRWDHGLYFDPDKNKAGKTYSKWGGFLEGVDEFDAAFFNISPREAETLDPQERLFLQCAYEALSDGGYTRETFGGGAPGGGKNVGVYVGVMWEEYQLYAAQETASGNSMVLSSSPSSIANRVSYFFNFQGPSMGVDTMCSSSLTSIHLACQSLKSGECDAAIAGGVNVSIHPNKYLILGYGKFASSNGMCESFGKGGDGYVPGEGVGAVLLKPLSRAIADGDNIYGIIKGTAVNHGGKASGFTVPGPRAQAAVIERAMKMSGFDADTISYVEAHGTGTSLGDPVEIAGLCKAYNTGKTKYCAIGSVKSNIGHCESAAGIAGVSKVLLQMRHGQLVPSLHSETLNPGIDFENSPFIVQRALTRWERPVLETNGRLIEYPRRAGISSFGAGGSNAHVIIEEYIPRQQERALLPAGPVAILISAKSEGQLREQVARLAAVVGAGTYRDEQLLDLAYTLQIGREAMEHRLALKVENLKELEERLTQFLAGEEGIEGLYTGKVARHKEVVAFFDADEDLSRMIEHWFEKKKLGRILGLWVNGFQVDWRRLYSLKTPTRLSTPGYPFAKTRYWPELSRRLPAQGSLSVGQQHPLVHRNTSSFTGQRYSSTFLGGEFFLTDHLIKGKRILPGVAYLEMINEVMKRAGDGRSRGLLIEDLRWRQPLVVEDDAKSIEIGLRLREDGAVDIGVYSKGGESQQVTYCDATVWYLEETALPTLDIEALKEQLAGEMLAEKDCYAFFSRLGIEYGAAHRAIDCIYAGENCALARLRLPETVAGTLDQYYLHPSLMDGSLQAVAGLFIAKDRSGEVSLRVPATIRSLIVYGSTTGEMWAFVQQRQGMTFDIDLCDARGKLCVRIEGLGSRMMDAERLGATKESILLLTPRWRHEDVVVQPKPPVGGTHVVIVAGDKELAALIAGQMDGATVVPVAGPDGSDEGGFSRFALEVLGEVKNLLRSRLQNRVLLQVLLSSAAAQQGWDAIGALLKTAHMENPLITGQVIITDAEAWNGNKEAIGRVVSLLRNNGSDTAHTSIRYEQGKRMVSRLQEYSASDEDQAPIWRNSGVYLISGGAGGLGLVFAEEIGRKAKDATVILAGRSALDEERAARLADLSKGGLTVTYRQMDITDGTSVSQAVSEILAGYGSLHGIIHSAGILADNFILRKSGAEMERVLAPKIQGMIHLDLATRDVDLDFFIVCSSTAAITGNIGQADYAAANAYMDQYAHRRNSWVKEKQRKGRTLSVNWPLWEDGGMRMTEDGLRSMKESFGMTALTTAAGLQALYRSFHSDEDQMMVLQGDPLRLRSLFLGSEGGFSRAAEPVPQTAAAEKRVVEPNVPHLTTYLKEMLAGVIKMPAAEIDEDKPFEEYGIDSVMVMQMTSALEKAFGQLSKTLFFEYQNISELAGYFQKAFPERLQEQSEAAVATPSEAAVSTPSEAAVSSVLTAQRIPAFGGLLTTPTRLPAEKTASVPAPATGNSLDIAIVGLSGSYPQARDLATFWEVLRSGKDCITEIPSDRWDHSRYFDPEMQKPGKTYGKWGGFLTGVEEFDPLFFNITPLEAGIMDPQERLFLECVYETLEDAGYLPDIGRKGKSGAGMTNVGVFVGVMNEEYQLYGAEETALGRPLALSGNSASVANRVSYFFNLSGPSLALNTMCSSSLTAIHLACQSLRLGECEAAIAGGVNVTVHPNKYMALAYGRFLSSKGLCESFGANGDGYVPGEGVGAILLKPLSKALADKDHIYGVIRGTAVNHGGKTNGYTVPNPVAQSEVIRRAIQMSGFDPGTISYLEAHGTGTLLGDPIEINGLTRAFDTTDRQFCSIGSVKSNIGHTESAAGIAGVTKVLLQMKHRQLVPSLHTRELNPHIDFQNTPFVVQRSSVEWIRPSVMRHGQLQEAPRRAGVSSFGAGGSNAHILIEEYISPLPDNALLPAMPVIVLLSAREPQQLKEQANRLIAWIRQLRSPSNQALADLAYTLQLGRTPFSERLAIEAVAFPELEERLARYIAGDTAIEGLYEGSVPESRSVVQRLGTDEDMAVTIDAWVTRRKLGLLSELWVKGLAVDWQRLYGNGETKGYQPKKISLPTYPFNRMRCWFRPAFVSERTALLLQKEWASYPAVATGRMPGRVAILHSSQTRDLAELLASMLGDACLWSGGDQPDPDEWKRLSACIDITGCGTEVEESMEWITCLQSLIEHGDRDSIHLLCITRGLSAFRNKRVNLSGALRAGLYRMLGNEYRHVTSRQVDVDGEMADADLAEIVVRELGVGEETKELCYRKGMRYACRLRAIERDDLFSGRRVSFTPDEVIWITGGTRGLGYLCARHLAREYGIRRMVLSGRHPLPPREEWNSYAGQDSMTATRIRNILSLESMGCEIRISAAALTDGNGLQDEITEVKSVWGSVHGVIHCAGIGDNEDPAFIRKSVAHIREVIEPKEKGLCELYRCFGREPLRFFILFSSVSAAIPSLAAGQSAYAMANGYMDHFAEAHADDCPIVSVQWPSWKETGMGEARTNAYLRTGLHSLTDAEGLRFLDLLIRERPAPVVMPVVVDKEQFDAQQLLAPTKGRKVPEAANRTATNGTATNGTATNGTTTAGTAATGIMMDWLADLFSSELKMPPAALKPDTSFPDYGIDSILITQLLQQIRKKLGLDIDPSVLFEYATLRSLSEHLSQISPAGSWPGLAARDLPQPSSEGTPPIGQGGMAAADRPDRKETVSPADIAVVGMACRFPGAENLEAYWNLLAEGRSAIGPVPRDRLDGNNTFHAGLIDPARTFDPEFFLLKESDARAMDPQALLILEESLALFCHAGYQLDELRGRNIGVYLGARSRHQPDPADLHSARNPILAVGQNYLAANVSQFFDLKGPSIVIDTACSSALVSMHMAIQALQQGELEAVVVGGIQLLDDGGTFRLFQQRGLLSTANDFHVFDRRSEGIILGEGAGLVLLKTLDQALAAGDRIYGVVKAVSINNDGRTAGPASPNIDAQKAVMRAALNKCHKQPEEISYIEVNGSGSEVTDLIELKAINAVYRSGGGLPCRLGSIKPNIGHPLCAEGIAGFIKVVEMLHRRQFVPFLSGNMPMKYFDLLSSPFQFSRVVCEWPDAPTVAAINCFADGGTNAHVILEAWKDENERTARDPLPVPEMNRRDLRESGMPAKPDQNDTYTSIWEDFK
jgi:polyketide synthase PksN